MRTLNLSRRWASFSSRRSVRSCCPFVPLILAVFYLGSDLVLSSALADIYEYVDSNGVSHFTNTPPDAGTTVQGRQPIHFENGGIQTPRHLRDSSAEHYPRYDAYLEEAARLYQLPVAFLQAVIHAESRYDANLVSADGAVGLMQLMPLTAAEMHVLNPFDPRQNILGGARFLRILANQWNGDLVLTVASYKAGADTVERYHGVPPDETRHYVNRVLQLYHAYRGSPSDQADAPDLPAGAVKKLVQEVGGRAVPAASVEKSTHELGAPVGPADMTDAELLRRLGGTVVEPPPGAAASSQSTTRLSDALEVVLIVLGSVLCCVALIVAGMFAFRVLATVLDRFVQPRWSYLLAGLICLASGWLISGFVVSLIRISKLPKVRPSTVRNPFVTANVQVNVGERVAAQSSVEQASAAPKPDDRVTKRLP